MATNEPNGTPPAVLADVQLIAGCAAAGRPVPAEVARRVQERSQRLTEETRRKHGLLNVAVPAIRELRGELPEP